MAIPRQHSKPQKKGYNMGNRIWVYPISKGNPLEETTSQFKELT